MGLIYIEQVEHLDLQEMQDTHEEEIKILNEIDKLATQYQMNNKEASKLTELETKIDGYLEHVKVHFANEERLMQKYNFPSYDMHKMAHDIFLMDIDTTIKQWKQFGNVDKVINFIRKSPEWIVMHINTVDAPTSAYLVKKIAQEAENK